MHRGDDDDDDGDDDDDDDDDNNNNSLDARRAGTLATGAMCGCKIKVQFHN